MYSSRSWTFHLFTVAFLCAGVRGLPTADPNINITVSVPRGTSDHGDPNLLCTPTKWLDILIFFSANYFAHAATVKAHPGEKTKDLAFIMFLAITFPFSGVARGLEAIVRHASFYCNTNDLQTAARAGALCIVVRNEHWKSANSDPNYPNYPNLPPKISDANPREKIKGKRPEAGQKSYVVSDQDPSHLNVAPFKGKYKLDPVTSRKVHGLPQLSEKSLPEGYSLALLPSNTKVNPKVTGDPKIILSSPHSIPQVIIAIVQVLYASYTLYKTRGDQLNRYGYAAFGLTVIPYIIMSFVNLLGNLLTPDYSTLYLVSSSELEEAMSRKAQIDGAVGTVSPVNWAASDYDRFAEQYESFHHIPECSRFETIGESYNTPTLLGFSGFLWWGFVVFFLGAIPYAVIGSLTHFQAGQSTQAQRVLTMFWLASGVFIGATIPFYSFSFQEMIHIFNAAMAEDTTHGIERAKIAKATHAMAEAMAQTRSVAGIIDRDWAKTEHKRYLDKAMTSHRRASSANKAAVVGAGRVRDAWVRAGFVSMFLGSLLFGASSVGGFVIVGQMLKDYGSCTLLS